MKPYYADDVVTLYHGDCREILPTLDRSDLLLTDPPYGIGGTWKGGSKHGWGKADDNKAVRNEWDSCAPDAATIALLLASADNAIIWGGNYFNLPPSRGWLVWNKPERNFTLAEAELAWTSRDMVIRVADLPRSEHGREHPTQKPLSLMHWCLRFFPDAKTLIDPFAGSGTSLVAAKGAGIRSVGVEAHEPYCEIAAKRLAQDTLFGGVDLAGTSRGCVMTPGSEEDPAGGWVPSVVENGTNDVASPGPRYPVHFSEVTFTYPNQRGLS